MGLHNFANCEPAASRSLLTWRCEYFTFMLTGWLAGTGVGLAMTSQLTARIYAVGETLEHALVILRILHLSRAMCVRAVVLDLLRILVEASLCMS